MPLPVLDAALLADIGGTNARFALADVHAAMPLREDSIRDYRVRDFDSLAAAAQRYLADIGMQVSAAYFAVAGRVDGDSVRMTNHHWHVSLSATQAELKLDTLRVMNDFYALAMGVPLLTSQHLIAIGGADTSASSRRDRVWGVLGPGTGLGWAALMQFGEHYHVLETEGGHIGFAPRSAQEAALLAQLHKHFPRVSNERLVCGVGLRNIHQALAEIAAEPAAELTPEQITARAADGSDPLCVQTLETFVRVFGAVAGDAVLGFGAWDGVYLAGGLVPHLLPWLQGPAFRERFEDKGRFQESMRKVPTHAIVHPQPGLLGAAAVAQREAALTWGAP